MKILLVMMMMLIGTLAGPMKRDAEEEVIEEVVIEAPLDNTGDASEADVAVVSEDEPVDLERAATFGHYAHVYGAGKEGQDRKEKDEAEQNAAFAEEAAHLAAAEEASRSWQYGGFPPPGSFPPPGMFPPGQGHFHQHPKQGAPGSGPFQQNPNQDQGPFQQNPSQDQGQFQPPPGWPKDLPFPPQMPQNPNQESGKFQQNPNYGGPGMWHNHDQGPFQQGPNQDQGPFQQGPNQDQGPFQQNLNQEKGPFQQNPNYGGPGQFQQNANRGPLGGSNSYPPPKNENHPQGFPAPPPWWPKDQPFPPQMPMEGSPGSDRHMHPPPHPDMFPEPGMFEDMAFMDDQKSGMPAGFPPMMDQKGGMPSRFPPVGPGYGHPFMGHGPQCPKVCDLTAYPACSCLHPAAFTKDGRGNCNVGSLKPDLQVWCYVDPDKGDPRSVCPDSKKSTTKPGYYWSRFACITE